LKKYLSSALIASLFLGCSSTNISWEKTKEASYKAATDPVTWVPAVGGGILYATYDDDITQYYMDHHIIDEEIDEDLRQINGTLMYATAIFEHNETTKQTAKRFAVDAIGSNVAKIVTGEVEYFVTKETPDKKHENAIGSHHATDTFANSALTRKNVEDMSIPTWGKYTLNTISYVSASGSAFARVQEGGHSFGDQMINASIGNFIGVFFYELLLSEENNVESLNVLVDNENLQVNLKLKF